MKQVKLSQYSRQYNTFSVKLDYTSYWSWAVPSNWSTQSCHQMQHKCSQCQVHSTLLPHLSTFPKSLARAAKENLNRMSQCMEFSKSKVFLCRSGLGASEVFSTSWETPRLWVHRSTHRCLKQCRQRDDSRKLCPPDMLRISWELEEEMQLQIHLENNQINMIHKSSSFTVHSFTHFFFILSFTTLHKY